MRGASGLVGADRLYESLVAGDEPLWTPVGEARRRARGGK